MVDASSKVSSEPETSLSGSVSGSVVPGSVVLALGSDDSGRDAVAVWQLSSTARPTGAWVHALSDVMQSREKSRKVLGLLERRAIASDQVGTVGSFLDRLSRVAQIGNESWWKRQAFSPLSALEEISARRAAMERTVDAAKQLRKNIVPLGWERDLVTEIQPEDFGGVRRLAGVAQAPGSPVVSEALTVSRVLHWLAQRWAETEQVKNRRSYVNEAHGEPELLPPGWLAAIRTAAGTRLPL